jgi:hypothetical protein
MNYDEGQIEEIETAKEQVLAALEDLWLSLVRNIAPSLNNSKANEYLLPACETDVRERGIVSGTIFISESLKRQTR